MLRKRSRSHQKDQPLNHSTCPESCFQFNVLGQKPKTNSFFNVPGLYVGFNPKTSESDSARSPTSPLDFRVFSNLVHPFKAPKSPREGHQRSWDFCKVGLGIVDSLDDDSKQSEKTLLSLDSKSILFGPQMRNKTPFFRSRIDSFDAPKSLPKDYVIFPHSQVKPTNSQIGDSNTSIDIGETAFEAEPFQKILSHSLDSGRSIPRLASLSKCSTKSGNSGNFSPANDKQLSEVSPNFGKSSAAKLSSIPVSTESARDFIGSLSASEIELSEDYTCVKTYGPNPKTTHIFCDCILERDNSLDNLSKKEEQETELLPAMEIECPEIPPVYPSSDFLSFCYSCKKKLEGKDIYIYRGEKAFCSRDCRSQEILVEEAMEKKSSCSSESLNVSNYCNELRETSMFI